MSKLNKIPDRWENYDPFGDVIKGTNILPLKVPLKEKLSSKLPEKERFTPDDLFNKLDEMKYRLGLVIDLTATRRYYDPNIFLDRDVQYEKIFTKGHVVPSPDVINRFTTVLSSFRNRNKNNDAIVGVHCTHGVNRTGYLICRYLIEEESFKPEEAIKAFKEARGYPIERENYIEDLLKLSSDRKRHLYDKEAPHKHFQDERKTSYERTRNEFDPRSDWRRRHERDEYNPRQWNGRARQAQYGIAYQGNPQWGIPYRHMEGNWRSDRGMVNGGEWNGFQREEGYSSDGWRNAGWQNAGWNNAGWNNASWNNGSGGSNWGHHRNNWSAYNQRTHERDWNNGPTHQGNRQNTR